jgi:hypothetical protein
MLIFYMKDSKNIKWIGLAKVGTPTDSDVLGGAKQGFTNVVGFAKTKSDFRNKTKNYRYIRLGRTNFESILTFSDRSQPSLQ